MDLTIDGLISGSWTRLPAVDITYTCGCDTNQALAATLPCGWSATHAIPTRIRTADVCVEVTTSQETEQGYVLSGYAYDSSHYATEIDAEDITGTTASAILSSVGTLAGVTITGASGRGANRKALSSGDVISLTSTIANTIDAMEIYPRSSTSGDIIEVGNPWRYGGGRPPVISEQIDTKRPKYDSCLCTKTAVIAERKTCLVAPIQPTMEPAEEGEQRVTQEWTNINQQLKTLGNAYNKDITTWAAYRGSNMQSEFVPDPNYDYSDYALPPVNITRIGVDDYFWLYTQPYHYEIRIHNLDFKPCTVTARSSYGATSSYTISQYPLSCLRVCVIPCGIEVNPTVICSEFGHKDSEGVVQPYLNGVVEWPSTMEGSWNPSVQRVTTVWDELLKNNAIVHPFPQDIQTIVNNLIQGFSPFGETQHSRFKFYLQSIPQLLLYAPSGWAQYLDVPAWYMAGHRAVQVTNAPTIDDLGAETPYWYFFGKNMEFEVYHIYYLDGEWYRNPGRDLLAGHTKVQLNPQFNAETPYDSNPFTKYNGIYKDTTQNRFYGFAEPAKMETKWKTVTPIDQKFTADSLALENATFGSTIISQGMYGTQLLQLPGSNQVDLRPVQGSTPMRVEAICPAEETYDWGSAGARPLTVTSGLWTSREETPANDLLTLANRKDGATVKTYTCPLGAFASWSSLFSVSFDGTVPASMSISQKTRTVTYTCKTA